MPPRHWRPYFVDGVQGLGDNIYQRAAVQALASEEGARVFVSTSWPQLYRDLPNVWPVRPVTKLRTQRINIGRADGSAWRARPAHARRLATLYGDADLKAGTIAQHFDRALGLAPGTPLHWSIPDDFEPPPLVVPADKPLALIRPATVREEWRNEARNPDPHALAALADHLRTTHYLVSVADLSLGKEWLVPPAPYADVRFHAGELPVDQLLGLCAAADLIVGGVGWIVPAAVATGTPAFVLLGGMGAHNAPEVILDPRMPADHVGFGWPAEFCRCNLKLHDCRKEMPDAVRQFEAWRDLQRRCGGGLEPARRHGVAA